MIKIKKKNLMLIFMVLLTCVMIFTACGQSGGSGSAESGSGDQQEITLDGEQNIQSENGEGSGGAPGTDEAAHDAGSIYGDLWYHTVKLYIDGEPAETLAAEWNLNEDGTFLFTSGYVNSSGIDTLEGTFTLTPQAAANAWTFSYSGKYTFSDIEYSEALDVSGELKLVVREDGLVQMEHISGDFWQNYTSSLPMVLSRVKNDPAALCKMDIPAV